MYSIVCTLMKFFSQRKIYWPQIKLSTNLGKPVRMDEGGKKQVVVVFGSLIFSWVLLLLLIMIVL